MGPRGLKYYFFSGKGGVGKTSLSAATAVHFAARGRRTLILTTDPASNLADVFEQPIGHKITPITGQENLFAMELDPDRATDEYKERTLAPLKGVLPESMLRVMEEQLDSPCTSEMATFERFVGFLDDNSFDVVVFDTAPTGHTLRLLELPAEWSALIQESAESGVDTCVGPARALADSKKAFDRAVTALKDPALTKFVFVLRPELSSIEETKRSLGELANLGISGADLVVNGILPVEVCGGSFFQAKFLTQLDRLKDIIRFEPEAKTLFLQNEEIQGVDSLAAVAGRLYENPVSAAELVDQAGAMDPFAPVFPTGNLQSRRTASVVKLGAPTAEHKTHLVFFSGKGGVGKTALSCAAAVDLAGQGHRTLLVTTDPAAHIAQVLGTRVDGEPRRVANAGDLWVTRIDPKGEAKAYKENILAEAKEKYSAERLSAMEDELDSPCTEEMAVFYSFIDLAASVDYDYIVFDTAPTGHTLRLLRLPVEWSKQLEIKTFATKELSRVDAAAKSRFDGVIDRLQDQAQTSFILVMLPEHTPIIEAHRAAEDLLKINIRPAGVIVNQLLEPSQAVHKFFAKKLDTQKRRLVEIGRLFSAPLSVMPLLSEEPRGLDYLKSMPIAFETTK